MARSISTLSTAASGAKICFKIIKREPKPNTAKPATPIPITEPPVKDTFKACFKLVLAASAVRTLALVAIRIPINPARALKKAPNTNAMAILQCELWLLAPITPNKMAAIITKYVSTLYSAFKKAIAPSAM